jgi:predicted nucleotide-binding protein
LARRPAKSSKAEEPIQKPKLAVPRGEAEEKLNAQIKEGEDLVAREPRLSANDLKKLQDDAQTWTEYTSSLLQTLFDTEEIAAEFSLFIGGAYYVGMPISERWQREREETAEKVRRLRSIARRLPLVPESTSASTNEPRATSDSRDIFVVHGHNEAVKQSVARFLEKLDLRPIILHEQPNKGRTVIEKFEAHSDVRFAVVLLTPDDVGALASASDKLKPRARQNVVLELGYFIGKLGRAQVCALYEEGVEIPSDIHGVLFVPYDSSEGWRLKLATEIRAAGIEVDLNRAV